jgi:hypothetical protein
MDHRVALIMLAGQAWKIKGPVCPATGEAGDAVGAGVHGKKIRAGSRRLPLFYSSFSREKMMEPD